MDRRRQSNRKQKSTNLPEEFRKQVADLIEETFGQDMDAPVIVEGRIYPDEILLSVGFKPEEKGIRQINFEASIDHDNKDVFKKLGLCLDAIASMMEHFFDVGPEEADLPLSWQPFQFEKSTVFLQYSGRNTDLESQANELLGLPKDETLYDEEETLLEEEEDNIEDSEDEPPPEKPKLH